jgi:trehalose 6-phosphate phosphatase
VIEEKNVTNQDAAQALLREVCNHERAGLLTDIDGTISELVSHPEDAVVERRTQRALSKLTEDFVLVGAVSGRASEDARKIVGLDNLVYSGNHGMEIWRNNSLEQSPLAARYTPTITELLGRLITPQRFPEIFIEHKGLTASVHYRNTDDSERVKKVLLDEIEPLADDLGLRVTEGQMVIEIRPPVELSKGTSVLELIDVYDLQGLIYLGDDTTDVDAFRSLRDRREQTGFSYYSIGVIRDTTPPEVVEFSDATVSGVDGVITLLERCGGGD